MNEWSLSMSKRKIGQASNNGGIGSRGTTAGTVPQTGSRWKSIPSSFRFTTTATAAPKGISVAHFFTLCDGLCQGPALGFGEDRHQDGGGHSATSKNGDRKERVNGLQITDERGNHSRQPGEKGAASQPSVSCRRGVYLRGVDEKSVKACCDTELASDSQPHDNVVQGSVAKNFKRYNNFNWSPKPMLYKTYLSSMASSFLKIIGTRAAPRHASPAVKIKRTAGNRLPKTSTLTVANIKAGISMMP